MLIISKTEPATEGRKGEAGLETNLRDRNHSVGRITTLGPVLLLGQFCTLLWVKFVFFAFPINMDYSL